MHSDEATAAAAGEGAEVAAGAPKLPVLDAAGVGVCAPPSLLRALASAPRLPCPARAAGALPHPSAPCPNLTRPEVAREPGVRHAAGDMTSDMARLRPRRLVTAITGLLLRSVKLWRGVNWLRRRLRRIHRACNRRWRH